MIALPSRSRDRARRANVRVLRPRLADALRRYVDRTGLSQSELGRRAGINHASISRVLAGDRHPDAATIVKLAGPLGLTGAERDGLLILAGYIPRGLEDDLRLLAALGEADRELVRDLIARLA